MTSFRDLVAEKIMRLARGFQLLLVVVASRFEDLVALHTLSEDLLHLLADLPIDSQKALEAHKLWLHDLHHPFIVDERVLEDGVVDGNSQFLW